MNFGQSGLVVIGGALLASLIGGYFFIYRVRTKAPLSAPEGWGTNPDDRKWEKEAAELAHTELAGVHDAAKNWAASIGALLTVGGTVGLVKGEEAFAKLTASEGNFAFWLTVAAAVLAGLSIAFATFAAQGTPARYKSLDGWTFRQVSRSSSLTAMRRLLWSKILAVVGAIAVLTALGISWKSGIASEEPAAGVTAIATTVDGRLRCGELSTSSLGGVSIAFGKDTMRVDGSSEIEIVESCPPRR